VFGSTIAGRSKLEDEHKLSEAFAKLLEKVGAVFEITTFAL
jgi:hypothetical protein